MWNVLTCICHYSDDSTPEKKQIHIVPEENDAPPLPNSCGKIVSSLTCSILPHDRCPRRRPWLCPSLPIHIFVDNDFKLTRMFQTKLSNLVFCTNQDNVNDKASPTGLVVLALRIRLTHNQATGESVKDRSFLKTLLCALFRRNQMWLLSQKVSISS